MDVLCFSAHVVDCYKKSSLYTKSIFIDGAQVTRTRIKKKSAIDL